MKDNSPINSKQSQRKAKARASDRRDILNAASKLFAAKGIEQTTMTEIADESGFSVGKIYKFFPSKKSLFLEIVGSFLEYLQNSSLEANDPALPPLQRLQNVLQAAIDVANSDPDRVLIHLRESPSLFAELKIHYQDIYVMNNSQILAEAMEAGQLKPHDSQLLAIMLVGAVDSLFSHLATSSREPFSDIPRLVFDHLISPLVVDSNFVDKKPTQ
ncbi:MAG: TetR/AcrR family transcriptional regulator [Candidatus Krumholzibacteria bacterium]|nr:TetR/AcrR family transcriptional regulator [Candidatus Krumholzibacteria bacterium]